MSNYETAEQRQIRELRSRISYMESRAKEGNQKNAQLQSMLEAERKKLEEANRRIEEQARKQRQQESEIAAQNANIKALDKEIKEKERLQRERMERMQRQHAQAMQQMQQNFEKETRDVRRTIAETRTEMRRSLEQMKEETDRKLKEQETDLRQAIKESAEIADAKIRMVDQKVEQVIADMKAHEESELLLAQYWTEQANRLLLELVEEHRGELFAPAQIAVLRRKLETAATDIENERYTSAADGGREAFYNAMDLKEEVFAAELEWNFWFNSLKEKELQLLQQLNDAENRVYQGEIDGESIVDDAGIDYWTRGQLTVLRERIERFQQGLEGIQNKPTEDVKQQLEEVVTLMEELALLENTSHTNFVMAISRLRMAGKVGEILGDTYHMIDCDGDFYSSENNESYHAIFENPATKDQAAVVVTPVYGEDGVVVNHIELIVGNADNNPITRAAMYNTVAEALADAGLVQRQGKDGKEVFPCTGRHQGKEKEEIARVGNIEAVAEGKPSAKPTVTPSTI